MKQFNYNALDESGTEHKGFIEGLEQNVVLQQLRQRGLYVLNLDEEEEFDPEPENKKDAWAELIDLTPVTTAQKVFFFKQLALMLRSGMSITEAFDIIIRMQTGRMKQISISINHTIKSGDSFSTAMLEHEGVFSKLAVHMIRSAETSGELDIALMRIARYMEHKAELKKQVIAAMAYPAFTLLAAIGVLAFLLIYIIPKFQEFLQRTGKQVPPSTQMMIDLGNFFTNNWMILLAALIVTIIIFVISYKKPEGRLTIDKSILFIPVIGSVVTSAAMAQLSWGLGILLKSGIPVVDSLRIIADMIGNQLIARNVGRASEKILHGADLASSFDQPGITSLVHQLMAVGERSGNLVQIMDEASVYYEDDLRSKTKALASLVEPIAILLIGGIVGFVYYGFFQALMSVSTGR